MNKRIDIPCITHDEEGQTIWLQWGKLGEEHCGSTEAIEKAKK